MNWTPRDSRLHLCLLVRLTAFPVRALAQAIRCDATLDPGGVFTRQADLVRETAVGLAARRPSGLRATLVVRHK